MPTIGDKIRVMRKSRGWDQQTLADKVGVKRNTVSMWESNKRLPGRDISEALADAFNVPLSYLYDRKQIEISKTESDIDDQIMALLASYSVEEKKHIFGLLKGFANREAK